jgi:hypothetical protein
MPQCHHSPCTGPLVPVLAVARAAVPALGLPAPVLAVACAEVLALALLAPLAARTDFSRRRGTLFRNPARTTAKPKVLLAVASTAACVCVLAGTFFFTYRF